MPIKNNSGGNAVIQSPQSIGPYLVDPYGNFSVNAGRTWIDPKTGKSFMNVNVDGEIKAVQIETNATLTKDAWIRLDRTVRRIATIRLGAVMDLMNRGLVYPAGDLGTTIAEWENVSDMTDAEINMDGVTMTEMDTPEFELNGVPIPIIRKDFKISLRRLMASRRAGTPIDTTGAAIATRLVSEKSEDMLVNGVTKIKASGYSIYGYTSHPQRNTGTLQYDWAADATTGAQIYSDVLAMVDSNEQARHYGPYVMYIPANYNTKMEEDFSTSKGDNTIRQRILAHPNIQEVKVLDKLADDNVLLIELTEEVVDLAMVQDITTLQWRRGDGMIENFAVLAGWAPRIKPDQEDRLGITHFTYTSG